jgi:histidinol-phosphate/aromatic aminotransferase/cobyric acid decarboxylase-like protein
MVDNGPKIMMRDINQLLIDLGAVRDRLDDSLSVSSFEFREGNDQIIISLDVPTFSDVDQFTRELESRGYTVRTLGSQARNGKTTARIAVGVKA